MKTFADLVFDSFSFLINDYGYHYVNNVTYEFEKLGNGNIVFVKDKVSFTIYKERLDDIYVEVGVLDQEKDTVCTLNQIITFSKDVENKYFEGETLLNKRLIDRVKTKTKNCAFFLLSYCQPLLVGDFSWWANVTNFVDKYYPKVYSGPDMGALFRPV